LGGFGKDGRIKPTLEGLEGCKTYSEGCEGLASEINLSYPEVSRPKDRSYLF
jgi:hypothetical protein